MMEDVSKALTIFLLASCFHTAQSNTFDLGATCDMTDPWSQCLSYCCGVESECVERYQLGIGVSCNDCCECASGICSSITKTCDAPQACGDPHMTGFMGQKFDFTGKDGSWYAVVSHLPSLHINMRVTSPVPSLPEITYITGLSVITTDSDGALHSIVITVKEPHDLTSACPAGVSPCLAEGALSVQLDGKESLMAPGSVTLGPEVRVTVANLPGECRTFGFEEYWNMKREDNAARGGRRLSTLMSMDEWILTDPTVTNMKECVEYVARAMVREGGLFDHESEHATFQIATPEALIRLSHGRLHQLAMRDPTDQYDLPDHRTWQMNLALDRVEFSRNATGILGETLVPTRDAYGNPIMNGPDVIRGAQDDYVVDGPVGIQFPRADVPL